MNTKHIIAISAVLLIAFVFFSYQATNKPEKLDFPDVAQISKTDHKRGTGKNILIEYGDIQCPACKNFYDFLANETKTDPAFAKVLSEKYTFVYREFPLQTVHKNAQIAAQSAEAAGAQGKFFEFIDAAYTHQDKWSASDTPLVIFEAFAKDLGLDIEKFKKDTTSDAVKKKIEADVQSGLAAQVDSTPSFYINGEKIVDFGTLEDFKKIIIEKSK